jgi:hypothetical protein
MRLSLAVLAAAALSCLAGAGPAAPAGAFTCMSAISSAQATSILGVPARVVPGSGGADDCGIDARPYGHIIVTGYVVERAFFDRVRRQTRNRTIRDGSTRTEQRQRTLQGFGAPAFAVESKTWFEGSSKPSILRMVFVYKNGRMLRPTSTPGREKVPTLAQMIQLARVAARSL